MSDRYICSERVPAILASFLLSLALFPAGLIAQVPALEQARPIALVGGTIHTVSDGTIEGGTILFEGGRIRAIGYELELPAGVELVDIAGKHIYPGLIDAFGHLGLSEIEAVTVSVDLDEFGEFNPNVRAEVAFNAGSRHIGVTRSNGVLIATVAPAGLGISGLATSMTLDGWTWEEMVLKAAAGMVVNWPSALWRAQYEGRVRRLNDYFTEAAAYHRVRSAEPDRVRYDSRFEAMIPVFERKVPVIANVNTPREIHDALELADQHGVRLIIRSGRAAAEMADILAEREIPVLLSSILTTPVAGIPGGKRIPYDELYSLPARLYEAGVQFGMTGETSAQYTGRLPYEASAAIAYGLPTDLALRAVTLSPAEILGIDHRVGSLEVGKDATLIVTTGDPLEYSTRIEAAFIEGRKIDLQDAHREEFERYSRRIH